jgi:hypothetical protein
VLSYKSSGGDSSQYLLLPCAGDGSCQIHAVLRGTDDSDNNVPRTREGWPKDQARTQLEQKRALAMRKQVHDYLVAMADEPGWVEQKADILAEAKEFLQPSNWGGNHTLRALANINKARVYAWTLASSGNGQLTEVQRDGYGAADGKPVHVLYVSQAGPDKQGQIVFDGHGHFDLLKHIGTACLLGFVAVLLWVRPDVALLRSRSDIASLLVDVPKPKTAVPEKAASAAKPASSSSSSSAPAASSAKGGAPGGSSSNESGSSIDAALLELRKSIGGGKDTISVESSSDSDDDSGSSKSAPKDSSKEPAAAGAEPSGSGSQKPAAAAEAGASSCTTLDLDPDGVLFGEDGSKVSLGIRSNDQLRYLSRGDYWFHSGKRYLVLFARQTPAGALTLHARDEVSKEEAVLQLSDSTDLSRDTLSLSENSSDLPQTPAVQKLLEEKLARMSSGGKGGGTGGGDAAGSKSSNKRGKGGRRSGTSVSEDGSDSASPSGAAAARRASQRSRKQVDRLVAGFGAGQAVGSGGMLRSKRKRSNSESEPGSGSSVRCLPIG